MRIAILDNLGSGGAMRVVEQHARLLVARGHTVRTYAPGTPLENYREACRFHQIMAHSIKVDGCDVAYLHTCTWTGAPWAARHLSCPSVYFCQEPYFDRILWQWDHLPQPPSRGRFFYRWLMKRRRAAERVTLERVGRILVNARHMKEEVEALWGRPATVCRLGVDAEAFRPLGLTRRREVISVGALYSSKGFRFVVEALGTIPAPKRPPLTIVANVESAFERAAVEALARERGVALTVRVGVDHEELVRLYNEAQALVYAPHREPFGLVVLEAMACGLPMVGVDEGGLRESVAAGCGRLVPRDASAFGAAVVETLDADFGSRPRDYVVREWPWSVDIVEKELAACASRS